MSQWLPPYLVRMSTYQAGMLTIFATWRSKDLNFQPLDDRPTHICQVGAKGLSIHWCHIECQRHNLRKTPQYAPLGHDLKGWSVPQACPSCSRLYIREGAPCLGSNRRLSSTLVTRAVLVGAGGTLPSAQLGSRGLYSYDSGCVIRLHGIVMLLPKYDKYAYQGKGHIK